MIVSITKCYLYIIQTGFHPYFTKGNVKSALRRFDTLNNTPNIYIYVFLYMNYGVSFEMFHTSFLSNEIITSLQVQIKTIYLSYLYLY